MLVAKIAETARELGITVLGEGEELKAQSDKLKMLDVNYQQVYFFGKSSENPD
jgi:EAL domain-containing protein (putative c-di-GMP-specific phosphodiesterase class I)